MKRKLYSERYIKNLKAEAKRPVEIENGVQLTLEAMVNFIDREKLTDKFEEYVKENEPKLTALLDEV